MFYPIVRSIVEKNHRTYWFLRLLGTVNAKCSAHRLQTIEFWISHFATLRES